MTVRVDRRKLFEARYLKGLSQNALAVKAGVSNLTVANIENGLRTPVPSSIRRVCEALDLRVEDIIEVVETVR